MMTITVLGASLHDTLTRLKAEPQRFPHLDIIHENTLPVKELVILGLPENGIRLRFDGPEQRLRLIEVLDFSKNRITYKDRDVLRPAAASGTPSDNLAGPTFRHIYKNLIGPTFPGEYIEPEHGDETGMGLYVLSYPGIAFSFPMHKSSWSPGKDVVSLLSSSTAHPAVSMAIFNGDSWADARETLYTQTLEHIKTAPPFAKSRESVPDEVSLVRIYGEGRLELVRPWSSSPLWIQLGETTPQQLVAELGPPDAIYRKNDQRMSIHNIRTPSMNTKRPDMTELRQDDSTDTDQSSVHTATDDSDEDGEQGEAAGDVSGECFYNYFYRGFDILLSTRTTRSPRPPSKKTIEPSTSDGTLEHSSEHLVASKIILHGNVPGSYPFNRHRRCRWEIEYLNERGKDVVNSESPFKEIESRLQKEWQSAYKDAADAQSRQRGMVLNRDWGNSPGSSCELLGGWEESAGGKRTDSNESQTGLGNTTLYGFPGLVFEVLNNGAVSGVTVF